jgi:hypothetical protein
MFVEGFFFIFMKGSQCAAHLNADACIRAYVLPAHQTMSLDQHHSCTFFYELCKLNFILMFYTAIAVETLLSSQIFKSYQFCFKIVNQPSPIFA